jgi:hypothetical protein
LNVVAPLDLALTKGHSSNTAPSGSMASIQVHLGDS